MDPISHVAIGRTLIGCRRDERQPRTLIVAGMLGALSPDLDAIVMPFGWDRYLRVHEIGTHSAIGTIAAALLTALGVRSVVRAHPVRALFAVAWVGAVSHVLLDLLSSARLRIFWPFADHQISVPLVAMADPWLAGILVLGVAAVSVSAARHRPAGLPFRAPPLLTPSDSRIPTRRLGTSGTAASAIGVAAAFLAIKGVLAARAVGAYSIQRGDTPALSRVVEARWASLTEWHIFDRTPDHLRYWRANGVTREAQLVMTWPVGRREPLFEASRALPAVDNFLHVHDLTFPATVERPDGRRWVVWSDIRFCWNPDRDGAPMLDPVIASGEARMSCALWFGGEYDAAGNALQQLVKVGSVTQQRRALE